MPKWNYTVTIAGNVAAPPAGLTKGATVKGFGTLNCFDGIDMTVGDVQSTTVGPGGTITFSVRISTKANKPPFKDGNGAYGMKKVTIGTQDCLVTGCNLLDNPTYAYAD